MTTPSWPTLRHRLADQLADLFVTRRDGGDLRDALLAGYRGGGGQQRLGHGVGGLGDAQPQCDGVGAGGDVAQSGLDDGLRQHGGGGGAVAGDVVGLGGHRLDQLGAEVLERILEVDLAGDGDAVVGDGRAAERLGQHDVAVPRGPSVTRTASASLSTPASIARRAVSLNSICLLMNVLSDSNECPPRTSPVDTGISGAEHVAYLETTASTSRADRIRYSSLLYLISVPPYLL